MQSIDAQLKNASNYNPLQWVQIFKYFSNIWTAKIGNYLRNEKNPPWIAKKAMIEVVFPRSYLIAPKSDSAFLGALFAWNRLGPMKLYNWPSVGFLWIPKKLATTWETITDEFKEHFIAAFA